MMTTRKLTSFPLPPSVDYRISLEINKIKFWINRSGTIDSQTTVVVTIIKCNITCRVLLRNIICNWKNINLELSRLAMGILDDPE